MYTLRMIKEERHDENSRFDQFIQNNEMGTSYCRVDRGCSEVFDCILKDYSIPEQQKIRSFLMYGDGITMPLYMNEPNKTWSYFIMTDSGKTFERL